MKELNLLQMYVDVILFFVYQVCDVVDRFLKTPEGELLKDLNPVSVNLTVLVIHESSLQD